MLMSSGTKVHGVDQGYTAYVDKQVYDGHMYHCHSTGRECSRSDDALTLQVVGHAGGSCIGQEAWDEQPAHMFNQPSDMDVAEGS